MTTTASPAAPGTSAIELHGVVKRFGAVTALDGVDLAVQPGTVFGVIGPNGAGKTTTMRLLLDLARPTSGRVRVLGEDVRGSAPALRRRIGYLPGELKLNSRARAHTVLRWYADLQRAPYAASQQLADRLDVDLSRRVGTLSKGNKQKLGLIQAFAHEPDLLVLDEPTSGLDPLMQQTFLELVREARDRGATVFLSSHVLSEIEQVADLCAVLRQGRIIAEADVTTLRRSAKRHCRVQAEGLDAARLRERLERLPGISSFTLTNDDPPTASFTLDDHVNDLLTALRGWTVHDLVISEPDLEEAVLAVYNQRGEEAQQ